MQVIKRREARGGERIRYGLASGLTNSRGLGKILQFDGLGLKMTILPSVETLGEPTLTRQAFYFLDDVEAVAKTRFTENSVFYQRLEKHNRNAFMEYILDNYLFSYSILHDENKMTSKIERYPFLSEEIKDTYVLGDSANVNYLAVDTLNDKSIVQCKDTIDPNFSFEWGWKLFDNYFLPIYEKYLREVENHFDRKILLKTASDLGITEKTLPVVKFRSKPYKYEELERISNINYVDKSDSRFKGGFYEDSYRASKIPMEHIVVKNFHNKLLLDMYFAGLREDFPTMQFKHFYNVLEYVFEDATVVECKKHLPGEISASITDISDCKKWKSKLYGSFRYDKNSLEKEETQLKIVINLFIDNAEFIEKVKSFDKEIQDYFLKPQLLGKTTIPPLNLSDDDVLLKYSKRIYDIRNSIMHTKRTRRGRAVFTIIPFSEAEMLVQREIPLLKFVAQKVIQKERHIFRHATLGFSAFESLLFADLLFENHNYDAFLENLQLFLSIICSKINNQSEILDWLIGKLVLIVDEAVHKGYMELEKVRNQLSKIDIALFNEQNQIVMKSFIFLLEGDMENFEKLAKQIPKLSTRANLYRLQTSITFALKNREKEAR